MQFIKIEFNKWFKVSTIYLTIRREIVLHYKTYLLKENNVLIFNSNWCTIDYVSLLIA